ncbi:tRNA threonylcarbamoyladenosine biosynthesis protein TsaE [Candidatus Pandoraea novymonadis]|uniref:tRNA threonylcarbamoyladenosine biosynthesis protein TsaE n=2 Tax=Candidatus Pandoraea novymonadis TaxID=1808959 RepID=A0ABX5FDV0_9BURK|nr:tRNA (adenosine(37)-N6)-threonylcarbamoyltransferase complex ATPase subunit type 1 TsaE [Candidatus Pandoraea novymonadis]PSB91890.1 tRNA threonylcarbamoyladenosine biosynthesis protein TsaE [Candidatus Pandoraea novymonadis]
MPAHSTSDHPSLHHFLLPNENATKAFSAELAKAILRRMITAISQKHGLHIQLCGELGSGKTTLVRALLHSLGHTQHVKSPTYTLCESYHLKTQNGPLSVCHFDFYRFMDPAEWHDTGFREHFNDHVLCLVEWPEKVGGLLGIPDLKLTLEPNDDCRHLTVHASTRAGLACLPTC